MSEAKPNQEPTMEEILASIRRIISEDGDGAKKPEEAPAKPVAAAPPPPPPPPPAAAAPPPPPPPPPPAPEPEPAAEEEVLELTEVVAEQAPPPPPPQVLQAPSAPPPPPPVQAAPPPSVPDMMTDDLALVSAPVADVAASKFTDLAAAVSQVRGLPVSNRTLEDIVKELLRPMLKDWLDANLPTLVHRIVEREVAKLAGRVDDGH